jgi:uncharacterized protein (DUF433 family)
MVSAEAPPLVREVVGEETYEYTPLGAYVVSATGVCDGEPTFKYTRIAVRHALELLAGGRTLEEVAASYRIPVDAVREALRLGAASLARRGG